VESTVNADKRIFVANCRRNRISLQIPLFNGKKWENLPDWNPVARGVSSFWNEFQEQKLKQNTGWNREREEGFPHKFTIYLRIAPSGCDRIRDNLIGILYLRKTAGPIWENP
jgi:hypothetical protein